MKLSMWTICDFLIKNEFDVETHISEGLPCISLLKQNKKRSYSSKYAEILISGQDVQIVNDMDRIVVKSAKVSDVLNVLSRALDYYTQWEHDLYECVLCRGTLQDLLDIANGIFDRPMFIKNDSTRTLAITRGYPSTVHPYWDKIEQSFERGIPDYEMVRIVSSDPEYRNVFMEKYPSIRFSPAYRGMVIHANIFTQGRRVAEVVTLENGKPFNKGDIHLMNVFTEIIAKYVNNNSRLFQSGADVMVYLTGLLETGRIENEQYQAIKKYIGHNDETEFCIMVASGLGGQDSPILSVLREKLETNLSDALVIQYKGQIVVLRVIRDETYDAIVEDFRKRIPKEGFVWGVSFEFRSLRNVPRYYVQACNVLENAINESKPHATMYEMAPGIIAGLLGDENDIRTMVHPDLLRLENADSKENTRYCETLFYYLLCGGNFTDTAIAMNLHRNTIIYRMNKIREIMHSNLDEVANRKLLIYSYLISQKEY
ncbi:MAG: PucR family transcriptional regulator [Lachnospiraceae bacterium]|jgi:hypothetical protein